MDIAKEKERCEDIAQERAMFQAELKKRD